MTYTLISLGFLAVTVLALAIALAKRADRRALIVRWRAPVIAAGIVVMILTAIFDNVMIASGLMEYGQETTSGLVLGLAPLEDFAYPLAALILLPAVWLLTRKQTSHDR